MFYNRLLENLIKQINFKISCNDCDGCKNETKCENDKYKRWSKLVKIKMLI